MPGGGLFANTVQDALVEVFGQAEAVLLGHADEHFAEQLLRRLHGLELVADPALECRVHQVVRMHVRGEDDDLVEGDHRALAGMEREIVDAAVQRHDPAVENILGHDEAVECLVQPLACHDFVGDALAQDALLLVFERHGCGPEVLPVPGGVDRVLASRALEPVAHLRPQPIAGTGRKRLDELALGRQLQKLIDDGAGQFQRIDQLRNGLQFFRAHALDGQFNQEDGVDTGGLRHGGCLGRIREDFLDLSLGHQAKRNDAIAEPTAIRRLVIDRRLDVFDRNQPLGRQKIAEIHLERVQV
jgi:hypothetical protein